MKYDAVGQTSNLWWQPSSWPDVSDEYSPEFLEALRAIIQTTVLAEIGNVIDDAMKNAGGLHHRGHVVALALLCAVDALSSYAFTGTEISTCSECKRNDHVGPRYQAFVSSFFPDDYKPFAEGIYKCYRNNVVHSWNLFEASISPGQESICIGADGMISFGLLNFFDALRSAADNFLTALESDSNLQRNCLRRYAALRSSSLKMG
jgi:hypothetical protein